MKEGTLHVNLQVLWRIRTCTFVAEYYVFATLITVALRTNRLVVIFAVIYAVYIFVQ